MISFERIDHVQVCIPPGAEDEGRAFYGDLLGMDEIEKPPSLRANGGCWFRAGEVEVHLGVEEFDEERGKRHPAFEVESLADARRRLESAGVETFDEGPIPGRDRFTFRDPWGNRIELLERHAE